jgi:hypothetical protein
VEPEFTPPVLRYLGRLPQPQDFERSLVAVLASREAAIYPYQRHLITLWMTQHLPSLDEESLRVVRALAFRPESPTFLQSDARALLGKLGEHADLERLIDIFRSTSDSLEKAQLLVSLRRLERSRRNALGARVREKDVWLDRALRLVKAAT